MQIDTRLSTRASAARPAISIVSMPSNQAAGIGSGWVEAEQIAGSLPGIDIEATAASEIDRKTAEFGGMDSPGSATNADGESCSPQSSPLDPLPTTPRSPHAAGFYVSGFGFRLSRFGVHGLFVAFFPLGDGPLDGLRITVVLYGFWSIWPLGI